ncbi:aminopeptidase C [Porphyromonas sp. COT-290 OH3588]|uniref:aminopeptidase C n=1 Tax=Porphyromonas sp. COT-290 OH3588 TaxID=1515617 RepID=UPI00052D826E|nr:C1 family peptidase [Porphyromonas sp. COT-290 OH3588]KGN98860.1 aminopeptidase [Porphyromonas sp. COT-290 OH3588]
MKKIMILGAMLLMSVPNLSAQKKSKKNDPNAKNVFTTIKEVGRTSIKDQANSGTCWSYSGQSFIEEELIRMGKPEYDLSEMFVVSHSYRDKARKYVRMHGFLNYEQGGSFYDVLYVLKHYGAVPQSIMPGLNYGTKKNQHSEIAATSKAFLDAVIKNPNGTLSTAWWPAYNKIIDTYLGELPKEFEWNGKKYTPKSYAAEMGVNPDDYVSLTSYTHHPFYSKFILEIQDNWRWSESYNLPIEELMQTMEHAINTGYSFAWGSDVSEIGFTRDGIGVLADVEEIETKGSDQDRWVGLSRADKQAEIKKLIYRADVPELTPTQESRQKGYDNYQLTDDHGMTIFGLAKNQLGRKFFMVKNSWGETGDYKGIWYVSYNFVAGKTMNIVLHKDAIPTDIAKKLGLKK